MGREIVRRPYEAAYPFTLVLNGQARRDLPWNAGQDAILNEAAFEEARAAVASWPGYAPTPLRSLEGLAAEAAVAELHYKDEAGRFGLGSFKALGGAYAVARLLCRELSARLGIPVSMQDIASGRFADAAAGITVSCATDGNHGRAVAWGAWRFGCRCVIFIHASVSEHRQRAMEAFGAEVRRTAETYDDCQRLSRELAASEGWFIVSDTTGPGCGDEVPRDVMQGYEISAWEACNALDAPPTHVFLQTGVGGFAAAVAGQITRRWGSSRPLVILADPDRAACWLESFRIGAPTPVTGSLDTLMAGLACGEVSSLAWSILRDHADAVMAIDDSAAVEMMRRLARPRGRDPEIIAGESAVAGLAALMAAASDAEVRAVLKLDGNSRVLVFGTEGATDPELYRELVDTVPAGLDA
ncbi:diaminopropionate ammonia-lyase [Rhodobacteraceae bacterium DSL-40]|uniref:diaminopropionate ammonia-lyase n=1 Tax=Amaricoccus sp. B4 TaxID=3368557 RepID=UPI000DAF3969